MPIHHAMLGTLLINTKHPIEQVIVCLSGEGERTFDNQSHKRIEPEAL